MLRAAVFEFYYDIKRTFWWWKLLLLFLLTIGLVLMSKEIDGFYYYMQIYFTSWVYAMIKPKVNKINYFIPNDLESRRFCLLCKSVVAVLLLFLWYVVIYVINIFMRYYRIEDAFIKLISVDLLIILVVVAIGIRSSFDLKKVTKINTKQYTRKIIISILFIVFPAVHVAFFSRTTMGIWYIASTLVAYLCVILLCHILISDFKELDTSYENIKKPVKFSI